MSDHLADIRREYGDCSITPESLADDPIDQFRTWFAQAQHAGIYEPNAMSLATVNATGQPACRVVLLKDIRDGEFVFFTDYTSRKGSEIAANGRVSLLFWWDRIHRQVRIDGTAARVPAELSDEYFGRRPIGSRLSAIASSQSQVVESRDVLEAAVSRLEVEYDGCDPPRPETWGGYSVSPCEMEFWQGRSSRLHDRVRYRRQDNGWVKDRLSP